MTATTFDHHALFQKFSIHFHTLSSLVEETVVVAEDPF